MSAAHLMNDLDRLGIHLEAHGDRLRYSPRSAVTPELADRMKAHKLELLAILQWNVGTPAIDLTDANAIWQAALDDLDGNPLFPPDLMKALRAANAQWEKVRKARETRESAEGSATLQSGED